MDIKTYTQKLVGSDEERAVSPVIGVILMVAITVILAAVIAAFVMDIGDLDDGAPNAQFNWENTTNGGDDVEYTLTHTSGDNIDNSSISVNIDGDGNIHYDNWNNEVSAGDELRIDGLSSGTEVTVVWEADGSSTILTSYDG